MLLLYDVSKILRFDNKLLMNLALELRQFFQKYNIKNGLDHRSQLEAKQQQHFAEQLTKRNLKALQIELTAKRSKAYPQRKIIKVDLGDGIYCNLTDNEIKSEQTILTIHGAPGNCGEWAGIEHQIKGQYRWINMGIPGMDGQDERRGDYDGTLNGFKDLFLRIVGKLKLKRVTICAHSFGSTVGLALAQSFPRIIEGFINIAGLGSIWVQGMTYMYKSCIADNDLFYQKLKANKFYDKDEHREKIYQDYVANYRQRKYERVKIPLLNILEYFAFLKLTFQRPQHFGDLFKTFRESKMLRVLAYGNNDQITIRQNATLSIDTLINQSSSYLNQQNIKDHFKAIKLILEKRLKEKFGISIEGERIQEYLCFLFDDTGHNVHRRRPEELSRIIDVYLVSLQVNYEAKIISNSAL